MIFPPASFLDSSNWNDNNQIDNNFQRHPHHQHQQQQVVTGASADGSCHEQLLQPSIMQMQQGSALPEGGGGGGHGGQTAAAMAGMPAKPMSMSERARLARVPLPEQGLKCPRCDSANTKFCYFNNYSLSQPRHFCRACRRYWTRGGALRNVPVGGGYRRHAKRAKQPKQQQQQATSSSSAPATATTPALPAMLSGGGSTGNQQLPSGLLPPLLRLADFDAMSLGSTFSGAGMGKPPLTSSGVDVPGCYSLGGGGGGGGGGMEQWRSVQQIPAGFPFFHAMAAADNHLAPAAPAAMPPGMFHYLGLDHGGNGNGEVVGEEDHQFHHSSTTMPSSKREDGFTRGNSNIISMYGNGDHHHQQLNAAYTSSYNTAARGNHLL